MAIMVSGGNGVGKDHVKEMVSILDKGGEGFDQGLELAVLAQVVACLPMVQQVRGSIPGGVVNFHLKIFYLGARRGGDVHFLIARLCITGLD